MSTNKNPRAPTNNLVLCLDAANVSSYGGSGTNWNDLSYSNNNGVLTNGATFSSVNGGTMVFDGTNDCVVINNNADILSKTTYTKIAWFNITSYKYNIISGGNSGQHAMWLSGTNQLHAGHNGFWSTVTSTRTLSLNVWYFGAVTFNTTSGWELYVNGVRESTSSNTTTFNGNREILIGAYGTGSNLFDGKISLALVYNRVLSSSEILTYYQGTKGRYGI